MAIRIKNILQLEYIDMLKVITDTSGYDRIISSVGILDHEIIENNYDVFNRGEFVISTLSVARDNPEMVFESIKGLIDAQVAGMAIKSVYYSSLPSHILDYANKYNFPIFIFDNTFIENLINSINHALNSNQLHEIYESKIESILKGNISQHIFNQLVGEINVNMKDHHIVYFIKEKQYESSDNIINLANRFLQENINFPNHSLLKFRTGLLIIMSNEAFTKQIDIDFSQLCRQLSIDKKHYYIGKSNVYSSINLLNKSIGQAYIAYQTAEIQNKDFISYSEIGIYKLIIPILDQGQATQYAKDIIEPILQYDQQYNSHLYETLKTHFDNGCHTKTTAELLYQHKNTISYRINKVKKLIGPFDNDTDFNTQLSVAIKTYDGLYQSPNHKL